MDVGNIQSLITSLGFPIVCCVALGWFIYKAFEKFTAQADAREQKLYSVITEAQQQNQKLSDTNAQFIAVLNTYRKDLDDIKSDVSDIKQQITK
jgi:F0F1-type ATP synthase membrane subunit b/b'